MEKPILLNFANLSTILYPRLENKLFGNALSTDILSFLGSEAKVVDGWKY